MLSLRPEATFARSVGDCVGLAIITFVGEATLSLTGVAILFSPDAILCFIAEVVACRNEENQKNITTNTKNDISPDFITIHSFFV